MTDALSAYVERHTPLYQGKEGRIYILEPSDHNNEMMSLPAATTTTTQASDSSSLGASQGPDPPANQDGSTATNTASDIISVSALLVISLLLA